LGGEKFDESGIYGVVEQDFFDWVVEVEDGHAFIRTLSKRLSRFDWSAVEQDVLKVLYESVIGAETRKRLGEYYTPDWLAHFVVQEVVDRPLDYRVLDAACGSGTFLFHAIRRYILAAERAHIPVREQIAGVTRHVIGMDLHPVAVTLARVTYLLAIGRDKLIDSTRGTIHIPVYLGDSLQWQEQSTDLWSTGSLTIHADDRGELFDSELRFPDGLLENAGSFDRLVSELAKRAANRPVGSPFPSLRGLFQNLAMPEQYRGTVEATFRTMCRLHDEGRDHIWGYYVRNLARPLWLSRSANRVNALIGNPPWLAYRHMTPEMQTAFRRMSEARNLWAGAELATHQDLAGLFAVRACELYLSGGGRFGLVLPNTAIDRDHYRGFRGGQYGDASIGLNIRFDRSWDLRRVRPHFFPRAASVVFGARGNQPVQMPEEAEIWSGRLPTSNACRQAASATLTRTMGRLRRLGTVTRSPYAPLFTQGATFSPHFVFNIERQSASPLGVPAGQIAIRSVRSIHEKQPWRSLPDLSGVVESEFIRPLYNGDRVFPFRVGQPSLIVVPCNRHGPLPKNQLEFHSGLQQWWERAEAIWDENRSSDGMSLTQRMDYQSGLSKQFPVPELRVVYNRAGMHLVSAKIQDRRAIIANGLYWAPARTEREANYLCAILNAPITTELARPFMSYGKDERDIHKHFWELPIPLFDATNEIHCRLAELGEAAERLLRDFSIDAATHFATTRAHMRRTLADSVTGKEIDEIVYEIIS
jgi:hypothetical protein